MDNKKQQQNQSNPHKKPQDTIIYYLYIHMHTNVILTNRRHTIPIQKLKALFRHLLRHPVRKWSGPILEPRTHTGAS